MLLFFQQRLSSSSNSTKQAGIDRGSTADIDQWERKRSSERIVAAVMPIGNLLQRVSKLVSSSSPTGGKDGDRAARQSDIHSKGSPSQPVVNVEDVEGASSSSSQLQSSRDRDSSNMKRTSSELMERPSSVNDDLDKAKKKMLLPSPIKTSQLSSSSASSQPMLSFTPATPISPGASPSSSTTSTSSNRKNEGGRKINDKIKFKSSSPSKLSNSNSKAKKDEDTRNTQAEGDYSQSQIAGTTSLPEEEDRKSSSLLLEEGQQQGHDDDNNSDDDGSAIVLEEPEQMTEEDEQRLNGSQRSRSTEEQDNNDKISGTKSISNNNNANDDQSHNQQDKEVNSSTPAKEDEEQVPFTSASPEAVEEEDHPDMLPPRPPHPLQVSTSTGTSARTTTRHFPPPKPSILQRLPSQVISESPGSEYAPTPSTSREHPRDFFSLPKRGDTGGSADNNHDDASFNLPDDDHHAEKEEKSKSDDVDDDDQLKGAQSHHASVMASAVTGLQQRINKPTTTTGTRDYGFPPSHGDGTANEDVTPAATAADNKKTEEEAEEEDPPLPQTDSPLSDKGDPLSSSPPAFHYLEPSPHTNRFARDSPTSSVQSHASSVNEHSTPAGFMAHRRSSSQNAPREVKETTNAGYKDLPGGKRKLNNYILTSDIGRGSFGLVQIAKDEETGQEFAAKEFSKMRLKKRQQSEMIRRQAKGSRRGAVPMRARTSAAERKSPTPDDPNKNDLDLIRSEVAIMKKLDHPNVVRLYEVLDVQQDDSLFMIVELCKNGPIMNINMGQATEPMSEDTARNFFRQMILAIEYLHENGIIHRDIKPENILKMSDDQSIKLVDFGVSEMFDKEDEERELRTGGSPAFMAPELCMSGTAKVSGKATDIWALGVTLYCMVVGHLPFESHLLLDLYDKIKNDPVQIPDNLSSDLKDLISRLLEKDRSKRIRMNELREHPWVTCAGRDPLPSTAQNVTSVDEVTEDDLAKAIAVPSVSYIINAVRAASRWKRFTARRTQSDSAQSDGSTASTDMSRNGSLDAMDAFPARAGTSGGKDSNTGFTPLSQTQNNSSPGGEMPGTAAAGVARRSSAGDGGHEIDTSSPAAAPVDIADRRRTGSSSSQGSTGSQSSGGIKPALSFPQSSQGEKEKRPGQVAASSTLSPSNSQTGARTMVAFPEIDRSLSHQEHMSIHGIDDSSVEVLRHYEDTTGHMLPRSAIEETVRTRKQSPMPPDRQTASGPSPPL